MKRRDFFKLGVQKTAAAVYTAARTAAELKAENWFRPPFAVAEMDFLLDCTRCDQCINACEFGVVFRLPARYGTEAAGTPALDLMNKGCHLCRDWPCVAACEPGVLKLPDSVTDKDTAAPLPKLATAGIIEATCLPYSGPECGACAASCPVPGALTWENSVKPVIDETLCTGCAMCREACITDPKSVAIAALAPVVEDSAGEPGDAVQSK
jgi:ferredoxin-type protein NapG